MACGCGTVMCKINFYPKFNKIIIYWRNVVGFVCARNFVWVVNLLKYVSSFQLYTSRPLSVDDDYCNFSIISGTYLKGELTPWTHVCLQLSIK